MDKYFALLQKQALKSDAIRSSRHAAAIVYKGKVIALGNNKLKTHPIMLEYGVNPEAIFLHAEIDAIVKAINKCGNGFLSQCDLYVVRIGKKGNLAFSKPCEGCQKAIEAFNIRNVYFS